MTEARLEEMKATALELPKLQAEMAVLELEVADLEKRLPKEKEIPELLRTITKTAQRYNLKISNFNPSKIVEQPNYSEVPFEMVVQGNYHSLAYFLTDLGRNPEY